LLHYHYYYHNVYYHNYHYHCIIVTTQLKNFPPVIPDNEDVYYKYLQATIETIDYLSSLQIVRASSAVHVKLSPSHPRYIHRLIGALNDFHNMMGMRIHYSKSIKTSCTINFQINLE
jgi:hypothetical protein